MVVQRVVTRYWGLLSQVKCPGTKSWVGGLANPGKLSKHFCGFHNWIQMLLFASLKVNEKNLVHLAFADRSGVEPVKNPRRLVHRAVSSVTHYQARRSKGYTWPCTIYEDLHQWPELGQEYKARRHRRVTRSRNQKDGRVGYRNDFRRLDPWRYLMYLVLYKPSVSQ